MKFLYNCFLIPVTIVRQMMLSRSISKPHLLPKFRDPLHPDSYLERGGLEPLTSNGYKGIGRF